jgi:hypothetical protein
MARGNVSGHRTEKQPEIVPCAASKYRQRYCSAGFSTTTRSALLNTGSSSA